MEKKAILLLLLVFLPGCFEKKIWFNQPKKKTYKQKTLKRPKIKTKLISESHDNATFDEELDSFVLLDDYEEELNVNDGLSSGTYEDVYLDEDDDISFVDDHEGNMYDFKTIYYDFDRSSIRPDQLPSFEQNLALVKKAVKDGKRIVLEGHADNAAGTRAYNLQLSQKRAETAAEWFIDHEIPEESIKIVGRGSEMLIVPYGDKNEQAPNRRLEIYTVS